MCTLATIKLHNYALKIMYIYQCMTDILAVRILINQNITGLVGSNDTHLTCSFTKDINQTFINVAIVKRTKKGISIIEEPVAIFPPEKTSILPPSGKYLSGRVTLTNITNVSINASMTFNELKCEDENDYICTFNYVNDFGVVIIEESEPTRIVVNAFSSMPDSISYVIFSSERIEKQYKTSVSFPNDRYITSLSTNETGKVSLRTLSTDTVNITHLQPTEKSLTIFREGETVQFTCTGYIGKPPGTFIWKIITPQQQLPLIYSNETTVVDQIPGICSFRGTSTLTVQISEDHFKAKFQCFEKSQADVLGMFVETDTLDIYYSVRHINITKQPSQAQYDQKTTTITLTCSGDGNPEPTYKWFRQVNTRVILSSTNPFFIEDVIQNNSGVYICEAYNTIDDIEYKANYSVVIDIVHAVYVILIICAVVIGALVVRNFYYIRPERKIREQNGCKTLIDFPMRCYGSNVNPVPNNTVPKTDLEGTSDGNKESKNKCRSSGEDRNLATTVDIKPILEATSDSIYADPCDKIKLGNVSDKTDIDIN